MANIDEIAQKINKKGFKKKEYRVYDLSPSPKKEYKDEGKDIESNGSKKADENQLARQEVKPKKVKKTINKRIDPQKTEVVIESVDVSNFVSGSILEQNIICLSGAQLKIFNLVLDIQKRGGRGETGPIQSSKVSAYLGLPLATFRTSLVRIIAKGLVVSISSKTGRGGFVNLSVPKEVIDILEKGSDGSIDLISGQNNKEDLSLPDSWKRINTRDIQEVLSQYGETFGIAQLRSVYRKSRNSLKAKDVQESIDSFSQGLSENPGAPMYKRERKVAALLDRLNNGERFFDKSLEKVRMKNEKIAMDEKVRVIKEEMFEPEFERFFEARGEEELVDYMTKQAKSDHLFKHACQENKVDLKMRLIKESVRAYFESKVWPDILEKQLKVTGSH